MDDGDGRIRAQGQEQGTGMDVTASLIGEMAAEPCFNQARDKGDGP